MNLLAIDRSTDVQSVALAKDGAVFAKVFPGENARSADWPVKIRDFLAEHGTALNALDGVVVGTGPGSFAGIRAAIAFAQGVSLGSRAKTYGMPSAVALARETGKTAVIGDARRGKYWTILYDGISVQADFTLLEKERLSAYVPEDFAVVTPDGARIGDLLAGVFGPRYLGNVTPLARRIVEIALEHPDHLSPEPLPVYLSPAVRV